MFSKALCNLHTYIDADYKNHDTFATFYQKISLKSPGLSVVSDPRNVLRQKPGRLTV